MNNQEMSQKVKEKMKAVLPVLFEVDDDNDHKTSYLINNVFRILDFCLASGYRGTYHILCALKEQLTVSIKHFSKVGDEAQSKILQAHPGNVASKLDV